MTAKKILALFGDYLRPRVRRLRPRGYERPSDSNTDIRFQAWLRVVCHPEYPIYEKDLIASYVQCTADRWQQERLAEFEMALGASLDDSPFVHQQSEEFVDIRRVLLTTGAAAHYACVDQSTIQRWIGKGMPHEKRWTYQYINFEVLMLWCSEEERKNRKSRKNATRKGKTEAA